MNVIGKIGDKLKLTTNFNTEATFDFENNMKLEYTGYEDEIVKKIEVGNVSLPLNGSLITEVGEISNPIKAQNSLIFVRVTARDQYRGEGDFSAEQKSMTDKIKNYSITASFKALQDDAGLIDNRSEIY